MAQARAQHERVATSRVPGARARRPEGTKRVSEELRAARIDEALAHAAEAHARVHSPVTPKTAAPQPTPAPAPPQPTPAPTTAEAATAAPERVGAAAAKHYLRNVTVTRNGHGSLGILLQGGRVGKDCNPVVVVGLNPNGPAVTCVLCAEVMMFLIRASGGELHVGDELIAANDQLFESKFHYEITSFLRVRIFFPSHV